MEKTLQRPTNNISKPLNNNSTSSEKSEPVKVKVPLRNTPLAVTSFFASLLGYPFIIFVGFLCKIEILDKDKIHILPFCFFFILSTTFTAIYDIASKKGKKTLSVWILIINWGWIVVSIIHAVFLATFMQLNR